MSEKRRERIRFRLNSPAPAEQRVEGVHAYTDRVSVAAGESIRFHVSSSYPYELQVCRLGTDVNTVDRDQILHSFGQSPAAVQPIHPGFVPACARSGSITEPSSRA